MGKSLETFSGLEKAMLAWVQELTPEGVCITDDQLRIIAWNSWLETHSGLIKEKVIGRTLLEVFPDLGKRRVHAYFEKALAGEVSVLATALHKYLFAFPSTVRNSGYPVMLQTARIAPLLQDGKIIGTITTVQDVTEREYRHGIVRKQYERQELFSWALAQLLHSTNPEVMVKEIFSRISQHIGVDVYAHYFVSEDGKLTLHSAGGISDETQKQYGSIVLGEHLIGTSALERKSIVTCDIQNRSEPNLQAARKLGIHASICHPLLVDSKLVGALAFASRTRNEFDPEEVEFTRIIAQYVAVALDRSQTIAALKEARIELQSYAGSLESKVTQRTAELQETLNALESFSYSLAHDVRAPLRHIRGFADALHEDCHHELSETALGYVDSILGAIRKLDALTHDILAYGQLSQGNSEKTVVNLEVLLEGIVSHHPSLRAPGTLTIRRPLHNPLAERYLLEQCLTNLTDNAIKFVAHGTAPHVTLYTEAKDGFVCIVVEDNGIGVAPEFRHKIFGIFERLHTSEYPGTGIGLAIVAKATQKMGGRFGLDSLPGGGSRFWIELPTSDPTPA